MSLLLVLTFTACGKKGNDEPDPNNNNQSSENNENNNEDNNQENNDDNNQSNTPVIDVHEKHDSGYWASLYGTNVCPFSLVALGVSKGYHFRDGGELDIWAYTEENTGGWYVYDGYLISGDNLFAVNLSEADSFSSCCDYEAKAYTGKTLSEDERKEQQLGSFYILNSYTPVRTNWGIQFVPMKDIGEDFEVPKYTVYGFASELSEQEWFRFYIKLGSNWAASNVSLWAFEHIPYTEYPETLSKELQEMVLISDHLSILKNQIQHI